MAIVWILLPLRPITGRQSSQFCGLPIALVGRGGGAIILEVLTDNRNRTAGEVRATFTNAGGHLAETGAVSFMFNHVALIEYDAKVASADAMLEAAIDAGAEDAMSGEHGHEIYT